MVAALPKSLRYICHNGAGYDNIDVAACSERNIAVSSTPVAVNDATADVGIFLMIGALRQAHVPIMALREGKSNRRYTISDLVADHATRYPGKWQGPITAGGKQERATLGHDPKGKVLGILGMGGIGRVSCAYTDP
jgi:D-3-phosphoglycerate dehydrogenase